MNKGKTTKFVVLRKPVLMEDEGRYDFIGVFESHYLAEKAITDNSAGYFKRGDYQVFEEKKP